MRRALTIVAVGFALAMPYGVAKQSSSQTAEVSSADSALQTKVQQKLAKDASFKNVKATVKNGIVDLRGTVPSQPDLGRAKDAASQVAGVKSVNEHLSIGEASAQTSTANAVVPQTAQSETTKNTAGSIAGNAGAIGATTGQVKPTNPNVTIQSAATNNAPKGSAAAVQDVQTESTPTAASGRASLGMTPDTDSNTLRSQIDSALKSDPSLSSSQLNVDVTDTQIAVSGTVPSGKEKVTAIRIAQSYAGNRKVVDKVTMAPRPSTTQAPSPKGDSNPK